jgi:thiamine pyrophosphate-dependent acetolactate synthase large subunit-like protein
VVQVPITVASSIARQLRKHDVDTVFGIPGVHNLSLWWALGDAGIKRIAVRHEQAAMYAADGFARRTGRLGVCVTTSGPGAANTAGAMGEALTTGSPTLHITTSTPLSLRDTNPDVRRGSIHDIAHQAGMFGPVAKSCSLLYDPAEAEAITGAAIADAVTGRTGPVYLEVPADVLSADVPVGSGTEVSSGDPAAGPGDATVPAEVAAVLASARRPVIWAGYGAMGSDIGALASRLAAPVVTTLMARSVIGSGHDLALNAPPHEPAVHALLQQADVVLAIGTDFDGQTTQNWKLKIPGRIVRVDIAKSQLELNMMPDLAVCMDAAEFVNQILHMIPAPARDKLAAAEKSARETRKAIRKRNADNEDDLYCWELIDKLGGAIPDDVAVVADMTLAGYWASGYLRRAEPRTFMFPMGWGTLGFSIPLSIGVACGYNRPVVVLVGDAGALYAAGELATLVQYRLPVVIVVFNDQAYAMLEYGLADQARAMELRDLACPDFAALASSFGIPGHRTSHKDLPAAVSSAIAAGGPALIEVDNLSTPPLTTGGRWPLGRRS